MTTRALVVLGSMALALSGCAAGASGASTPAPTPTPTFSVRCLPPVPNVTLAYPIGGSTGVPPSAGQIVFQASSGANLSSWQVQLVPSSGAPALGGGTLGAPPNPLPSPIATLGPNSAYLGATLPLLSAATQYQVQLLPQPACLGPMSLGVFTTQ